MIAKVNESIASLDARTDLNPEVKAELKALREQDLAYLTVFTDKQLKFALAVLDSPKYKISLDDFISLYLLGDEQSLYERDIRVMAKAIKRSTEIIDVDLDPDFSKDPETGLIKSPQTNNGTNIPMMTVKAIVSTYLVLATTSIKVSFSISWVIP